MPAKPVRTFVECDNEPRAARHRYVVRRVPNRESGLDELVPDKCPCGHSWWLAQEMADDEKIPYGVHML